MLRAALDGPLAAREGTPPKPRRTQRPPGEPRREDKARADPQWSPGVPLSLPDSGALYRHVFVGGGPEGRPPVPPAAAAAAQQLAEALAKSGKIGPTARRPRGGSLGSPLASPMQSPATKGRGDSPGPGAPEKGHWKAAADRALARVPSRSPPLQQPQQRRDPAREPDELTGQAKRQRTPQGEGPAAPKPPEEARPPRRGSSAAALDALQEDPSPVRHVIPPIVPASAPILGSPHAALMPSARNVGGPRGLEAASCKPLSPAFALRWLQAAPAPVRDPADPTPAAAEIGVPRGACLDLNAPGDGEGPPSGRPRKGRAAKPGKVPANRGGGAGQGPEGGSDPRGSHDVSLELGVGSSPSKRPLGPAPPGSDAEPVEGSAGRLGISLQLSFAALGAPSAAGAGTGAGGEQGKEALEGNSLQPSSRSQPLRKEHRALSRGEAADAEPEAPTSERNRGGLEKDAGLGLTL